MKRKIIISLLMLLLLSATGVSLATYFMSHTTSTLGKLVALHQIEDLRQHLIISIQTVQSDLYTVNTLLGNKVDAIADHVTRLETSANACTGCHHELGITLDIRNIIDLIAEYQKALSYYITASANRKRIEKLQQEAAAIGNDLLHKTEMMSFQAAKKLEVTTNRALERIDQARIILFSTIWITFIFAILIAIHLIRSITGPVRQLVLATRAITHGDLDYKLTIKDQSEFGELADHFNEMSATLRDNYEKLVQEVAERKQVEEALRESEERYALAARGANDGLWDMDLRDDTVYYSNRWKSMLGYDEGEIGTSLEEWLGRVDPADREMVRTQLAAHLEGAIPHFECEYRIQSKDNDSLWMLARGLAVRDSHGKAYRIAGSQADITSRKKAEGLMAHSAFHDHLTGLPNRALFMDRLGHLLESSRRGNSNSYAVLFTDIDRFKIINDSLGHDFGDKLLVAMGQRIKICLRPSDTVARLGGDEFAVLLEDVADRMDIEDIICRIENEVVKPFNIDGHELFTMQSIGIATGDDRYESPEEILRDADIAMYQAKAIGGGRHVYFDTRMHATIIARNQLERELRSAVDNLEDFVLHYQPIMSPGDRSLVGFEALIRWVHPERGLVLPNDFIPLAEETGLIIPLSRWVLRQACRQLRRWDEMYPNGSPLKMSINISSRMLLLDDFTGDVAACIRDEGIQAESLVIEITENVILEHTNVALNSLVALQGMGVNIHIDDFGTGYSSLSYLHNFPVHALKIDRSFISKLKGKGDDLEIVKTIIALAHNLDLDVIAEGVEEEHQLSTIRDLECAFCQGFFFSRAIAAEEVPTWIKANGIKIQENTDS
ncbi:MAG: EAL domain-containing protein [Proteobacteria bacterium]|nr:EAL domain-containing protein [Pseudomonadota bacterium]MBU1737439.1 EAL domain-containing protein [Pseudomonadota bacterium]